MVIIPALVAPVWQPTSGTEWRPDLWGTWFAVIAGEHRAASGTDLLSNMVYTRGVKLVFAGSHISLALAFKGPNVIVGLYKCRSSNIYTVLRLNLAL